MSMNTVIECGNIGESCNSCWVYVCVPTKYERDVESAKFLEMYQKLAKKFRFANCSRNPIVIGGQNARPVKMCRRMCATPWTPFWLCVSIGGSWTSDFFTGQRLTKMRNNDIRHCGNITNFGF